MSAPDSDRRQRHEKLAKIVVQFRKIMQMILKANITPNGLKAKFINKTLSLPLTDIEIALMEELPNIDNFTVGLCYKILRWENFIDEPKSEWINELQDTCQTELGIGYDIYRIICTRNDLLSKKRNDITEEYYRKFTNEVKKIAKRVDAHLAHGPTVYDMICSYMRIRASHACLKELKEMEPVHDMRIPSVKNQCQQRDRISRIGCVILEKFPCFLKYIIIKCLGRSRFEVDRINLGSNVSSLYKFIRNTLKVHRPTKGWGNLPGTTDTTIGDDIERIRDFRNFFAHRGPGNIEKSAYEEYFSQFCEIGRRIDVYLENRKRKSGSSNSKCALEILECKTCHMDYNLQVKYENALNELENIKLRFQSEGMKLFYGDTLEESLEHLRLLMNNELLEGKEKIIIQIILQHVKDKHEAVRLLNAMKDKINKGLIDTEFKEANVGSIVLYIEISVENVKTDQLLQSLLIRFMERIISLEIITIDQNESIDAVLVSIEECSETKSELSVPLVRLDFEVEASILETDKTMGQVLCKTVTHLLDCSKVKGQKEDILAELLPISIGERENDFSEGETASPTKTKLDGLMDSDTLKTSLKRTRTKIPAKTYKKIKTEKRADIDIGV